MPAGLQAIDCFLEVSDVAMHVEVPRFRLTVSGVEPTPLVRVRVGEAGLAGEQWIAGDETSFDDREQVTDGLEPFDRAEPAANADRSTRFDIEHHFNEFAEHAGGELGEAHPPEIPLRCRGRVDWRAFISCLRYWQQPEVRRRVAIVDWQPGGEVRMPKTNGLHNCRWWRNVQELSRNANRNPFDGSSLLRL